MNVVNKPQKFHYLNEQESTHGQKIPFSIAVIFGFDGFI